MAAVEYYGEGENQPVEITGSDMGRELYGTVYGFLPYWVNQAWLQYDLISVLAVFSVDMSSSGNISNYHGFPSHFTSAMDQAHAAGSEVVITVTNFSVSAIHSILTTNRATAIATITDLVNGTVVDGVCIDFENVQSADAESLVTFMQDLRTALPDAHISICTPVVDWGGAFNYNELAESCNALMMMCYAFAGSWSSVAGPNAPLVGWGASPESASNMAWALCDYVRYAPQVHEKLVVGLPYYGHQWKTSSQSTHSPCSSCATLFYTTLSDRAASYGRLWDDESLTPWYAFNSGGWNQGWYDDAESLELKYNMVRMAGMQGIGIWALGYDGDRPELWNQLSESFTGPVSNDMMTDNLEDCCVLHGPANYWHPYTEGGQYHTFFFTGSISSPPDVNWIEWNFHLPDSSGTCTLEAFIPPTGTAEVTYHILHEGGEDSVSVDQQAFSGQWVSLGGPYASSSGLQVRMGDCTGTEGNRIVADAVRFSNVSGTEGSRFCLFDSGFSVSASPAGSVTVMAPEGGNLTVFDVSGRAVCTETLESGAGWTWNSDCPSGVYVLSLESEGVRYSCSVVILK